jgi:endonuclease YncB( thermonuclease family)
MGLCCSSNRNYKSLAKHINIDKRTFKGQKLFVKLHEIYDGDTFKVVTRLNDNGAYHMYSLRLSGLDTPELKPLLSLANRDNHVSAGFKVRDILRSMYPVGTIFKVHFESEDKYGRLLGTIYTLKKTWFGLGCWREHVNLCQWLLDQQLAIPYGGKSKVDFTDNQLANINAHNL